MADIIITVNGTPWTLTDDGDGTYSIDLSGPAARQPLRAERDRLLAERQEALALRDEASERRDFHIAGRDEALVDRTFYVDLSNTLLDRINEIRDFLTAVGDDPDA